MLHARQSLCGHPNGEGLYFGSPDRFDAGEDTDAKELISNYAEHKTGVLQPYEARAVLIG